MLLHLRAGLRIRARAVRLQFDRPIGATIYGSTFFMATGFHGAHVIIGTLFLSVCLVPRADRALQARPTSGLEFAAWYWHFVDVVWLFLFSAIYVWGNWGGMVE